MRDKEQSVGKGNSPTLRESNPAANEDVMKHGTRTDDDVGEPGTGAYGPIVEEGHRERQARAGKKGADRDSNDASDDPEASGSRSRPAREAIETARGTAGPNDASIRETADRVGGIPARASGEGLSGNTGAATSAGGSGPGKDAG